MLSKLSKKTGIYWMQFLCVVAFFGLNGRPQPKKRMGSSAQPTATKAYTDINSLNEFQQFINSNKPTIILFYAPWCGACTTMKPVFEAGAQNYKNKAQFIALDVTKEHLKDPIDMFGIQGIPTICYKEVGLKTKDQFNARLASMCGSQSSAPKTPAKKAPARPIKKVALAKKTIRRRAQRRS